MNFATFLRTPPLAASEDYQGISQKDKSLIFVANDTVSTLNCVTKWGCTAGYIFKRYDDRIELRKQITNKLHIPKVGDYIRTDHELYVKLFFTRSLVPISYRFGYGYSC